MVDLFQFAEKKIKKEKITMLTAYDYYTAKLINKAGIDIILVGDSLGMVFKGDQDTLAVTIDEVVYHSQAVRKGAQDTFIIADLPYMSYHLNPEQAKANAARLIVEGRANAVKLEGGSESRLRAIEAIADCEIPIVGHLGLTPQSINKFGGFKVQGRDKTSAEIIKQHALDLQQAGIFMLVLEAVPENLAKQITEQLKIPVIGIGAGRFTDGQVLVVNDLLGLSDQKPKFSIVIQDVASSITSAVKGYIDQVKQGEFPRKENIYQPYNDTE